MADQTNDDIAMVLSGDLEHASESDILRRLDVELQQQTEANAMVLSGDAPQPWVLGGEGAGGFGSMAQRFIAFYSEALHREICDPQQGKLKDNYRNILGGQSTNEQVRSLVPIVLNALGVASSFINPAAIGALVALWLIRTGLDQWCALPPKKDPDAEGTGAAPQSIDPSVAPTTS